MSLRDTYEQTARIQADLISKALSDEDLRGIVKTTVATINDDGDFNASFGATVMGFGFSILIGEGTSDLAKDVKPRFTVDLSSDEVRKAYDENASDLKKTADTLSRQVIEKLACQSCKASRNDVNKLIF
ncbi:MAG: hypothetical protein JWO78_175 [Micavibrio sp.]|nr:hypothetical protein [Micavibrio sp.]